MAEKLNKTDEDFYYELIAKELKGEISESEKSNLLQWVNSREENRTFYEQTKKGWQSVVVRDDVPDFNTEAAWMKVKARTSDTGSKTEGKVVSLNSRFTALKAAAAILLVIGIVAVMRYTLWNSPDAVNYATAGDQQEIYLPDSSKVILNKNSRLTYYTDFNSEGRKVYLEGEAFFEVKRTQGKTFEVFGARSITTVLGTSFSVRSVKNEAKEIVQVVTGKVSFADLNDRNNNQVILTPGFKGELDLASRLTKLEINDPNFIAWKENRLSFDNTELSVVIETLGNYFGMEIEVTDPLLLTCRFTGTFDKPKPDEVLEVLAVSTNSSYKITGNKVRLTGKGCNQK